MDLVKFTIKIVVDWDNPNWQSFKIEGLKCIVTQAKYN